MKKIKTVEHAWLVYVGKNAAYFEITKGAKKGTVKKLTYKTKKLTTVVAAPKKVTALNVKADKEKMIVSWKKDSKATGYQIVYAQNSKFTKGKKAVTISRNKTVKKTISKLKAGKTYYVKVRAYKQFGSIKAYGPYSTMKNARIR